MTAKLKSITRASNGNYIVAIEVANNGDILASKIASGITLGNLVIPGGSLGGKTDVPSTPPMNVALKVVPETTANITLVFPLTAGKPLTKQKLFV